LASDDLTHDNLLDAFPGAEVAECDGYGLVNARYPRLGRRSGPCPVCARSKWQQALTTFTPPRFRGPVPVPAEVREWASAGSLEGRSGLYIEGRVGTGKTHLAWAALALWCEEAGVTPHAGNPDSPARRPNVVCTRMTDLLDSLRPGEDGTLRVTDCQMAALLFLDDVGAEKSSEWTQERIYSVVDHRYAHCLPLIITSNVPAADLADYVGQRTASRLAEMCTVIPLDGEDRRWPQ